MTEGLALESDYDSVKNNATMFRMVRHVLPSILLSALDSHFCAKRNQAVLEAKVLYGGEMRKRGQPVPASCTIDLFEYRFCKTLSTRFGSLFWQPAYGMPCACVSETFR